MWSRYLKNTVPSKGIQWRSSSVKASMRGTFSHWITWSSSSASREPFYSWTKRSAYGVTSVSHSNSTSSENGFKEKSILLSSSLKTVYLTPKFAKSNHYIPLLQNKTFLAYIKVVLFAWHPIWSCDITFALKWHHPCGSQAIYGAGLQLLVLLGCQLLRDLPV